MVLYTEKTGEQTRPSAAPGPALSKASPNLKGPKPQWKYTQLVRDQPGRLYRFFYPERDDHETFSIDDDAVAKKRMKVKDEAKAARRAKRYMRFRPAPSQVSLAPETTTEGALRHGNWAARTELFVPGAIAVKSVCDLTAEVWPYCSSKPKRVGQ